MKSDSLALVAVACAALYDSAFADGVASVPAGGGGISPDQEKADIQAAVEMAIQPLNDQIAAMKLDKSKEDALLASVSAAAANLVALLNPPAPGPVVNFFDPSSASPNSRPAQGSKF